MTRGVTGWRPPFVERLERGAHPAHVAAFGAPRVLAHGAAAGRLGIERPAAEAADALDERQLRPFVSRVPAHVKKTPHFAETCELLVQSHEGIELLPSAIHLTVIPGLMLVLAVLGINVFGDGVRDALDPRAKVRVEH